ncbi:hypothetical protein BH09ACT10_BH09ACT10_26050 [soil metagenome]
MTVMTFAEVIELTGFSPDSLNRLVARGYVKATAPADRLEDLRFNASDVHQLGVRPQPDQLESAQTGGAHVSRSLRGLRLLT